MKIKELKKQVTEALESINNRITVLEQQREEDQQEIQTQTNKIHDLVERIELQQVENNKVREQLEELENRLHNQIMERDDITQTSMQHLESKINRIYEMVKAHHKEIEEIQKKVETQVEQ